MKWTFRIIKIIKFLDDEQSMVVVCGILHHPMSVFYSACNEDEDKLPPITMEGKNTFGCLVNGKVFVSKGRIGNVGTYAEVQYVQDTIGVNLYAMNSEADQSFVFSFYDSPDLL